jgi:site-specific DNA-methyltransferase (cytosine-N4-specific)
MKPHHTTNLGNLYIGQAEKLLRSPEFDKIRGKVQLIFTSPPFPLNSKKKYGNLTGDDYKNWFTSLSPLFSELIANGLSH